MNQLRQTRAAHLLAIGWSLALSCSGLALGADGIQRSPQDGTFKAEITQWPLPRVLKEMAQQTGWEVYVDPNLTTTISTRFANLSPHEALRRILGDLSFALMPQPGKPTRLFVYENSAREATLLVRGQMPETNASLVERELLLRLKPGTNTSIDDLASRFGAEIVGRSADETYRLRFADPDSAQAAREALEADASVASVENHQVFRSPDPLERGAFANAASPQGRTGNAAGDGTIKVAVLDTAVAVDSAALQDFILPTIEVAGPGQAPGESPSHGTAMVKTLLQTAAELAQEGAGNIRIQPIDVYGGDPAATTFDVLNGLLAAARERPDIINLSLGGAGPSQLLEETIRSLRESGILVIAAAGNHPTTEPTFPAAYPSVLAVTAADPTGQVAPYANRGPFIDLVAPGASVFSYDDATYLGTGTSYASAYISGAAAAYLSQRNVATPAEVDASLRQTYGYQPGTPATP